MVRKRRIDIDPDETYESFLKTRRGAPDVVVVIPSTGRPHEVCTKTIAALLQHGIQQSDIHLFVAPGKIGSATQLSVYRATLIDNELSEVMTHLGASTLTGQYNCIAQHFSEGQYLLLCSDNITRIIHRKGERSIVTEELPAGHFCAITAHAYHCMKARNCFHLVSRLLQGAQKHVTRHIVGEVWSPGWQLLWSVESASKNPPTRRECVHD